MIIQFTWRHTRHVLAISGIGCSWWRGVGEGKIKHFSPSCSCAQTGWCRCGWCTHKFRHVPTHADVIDLALVTFSANLVKRTRFPNTFQVFHRFPYYATIEDFAKISVFLKYFVEISGSCGPVDCNRSCGFDSKFNRFLWPETSWTFSCIHIFSPFSFR